MSAAIDARPSLMKQRAMSMTDDVRRRESTAGVGEASYASFSGKMLAKDLTASANFNKPSAIRQQIVVQSDGKPAMTYVRLLYFDLPLNSDG
jgi:hypothetical protein